MTAAIGEIIRNGILFDVKNWSKSMSTEKDFLQTVDAIFDVLKQRDINYLLVGGVALLSYVDGRNTQDIDLILTRSDLGSIPEISVKDENKDFIRGTFEQLQVDILLAQNKLFKHILEEFSSEREFGDRTIQCVTVEGLLILKCYALPSLYRQGNFSRASIYENDILLLLLNYSVSPENILSQLSDHLLSTDLKEVEDILIDIQSRIQRFSQQQKALEGEE